MADSPVAVLDACVLVNFALCDTLLRLAEPPALFEPKWSESIMAETTRTLEQKLNWPAELTRSFRDELLVHFSEAWVRGFEPLIRRLTNDPKDRHVLAAAIQARAEVIVTFNLRHFRPPELDPWNVVAVHPQQSLVELFRMAPGVVLSKLQEQAEERSRSMEQLLAILNLTVPEFVDTIARALPPQR